jgi:hypothetical protein
MDLVRPGGAGVREAELPDDPGHLLDEDVVLVPLRFQRPADLALGLGVDQVDADGVLLPVPLLPVAGLDEIGELEADADEDGTVRLLEVDAAPDHDRLPDQGRRLAVAPSVEPALALF